VTEAATSERRQLIEDARQLGVPLGEAQATTLLQLLDELAAWNRAYSLTAIGDRGEMIRAHLLDSLSAWPDLLGARIADVGTGAGFPGLPLAVLAPERQFLLLDSVGKKIRFVTHAARRLQLTNVTATQARVETLRPEALKPEAPFDTVIARAVAALPDLLVAVRPLLGPRTRVVALKGHYPREELAALPRGWRVQAVRAVQVPGLSAQRHIVCLVAGGDPTDAEAPAASDGMPPGPGSG
jgi:16S rRNA (guanine527-N7)-methyltransferase